jgi:hypothetical protein
MINKKTKTTLQFFVAGALLVSFAIAGCNNEGESKEATKDTVATEKSMEAEPAAPAVTDTTKKDTASTRPVIPAN